MIVERERGKSKQRRDRFTPFRLCYRFKPATTLRIGAGQRSPFDTVCAAQNERVCNRGCGDDSEGQQRRPLHCGHSLSHITFDPAPRCTSQLPAVSCCRRSCLRVTRAWSVREDTSPSGRAIYDSSPVYDKQTRRDSLDTVQFPNVPKFRSVDRSFDTLARDRMTDKARPNCPLVACCRSTVTKP